MPTIEVQLSTVKQRRNSNNVILTATDNLNRQIVREIDISDIDTWAAFAEWLIQQEPEFVILPEKEKSLGITFHTETKIDPETDREYSVRILDNVTVLK